MINLPFGCSGDLAARRAAPVVRAQHADRHAEHRDGHRHSGVAWRAHQEHPLVAAHAHVPLRHRHARQLPDARTLGPGRGRQGEQQDRAAHQLGPLHGHGGHLQGRLPAALHHLAPLPARAGSRAARLRRGRHRLHLHRRPVLWPPQSGGLGGGGGRGGSPGQGGRRRSVNNPFDLFGLKGKQMLGKLQCKHDQKH